MTHPRDESVPPETVGSRIKRFRIEKNISPAELAHRASISKSYVSSLENGDERKPSAEILYQIADALGVAMSDLLGRQILTAARSRRAPSLVEFGRLHNIPEADLEMLANIHFRGEPPTSPERWLMIYTAIIGSERLDRK